MKRVCLRVKPRLKTIHMQIEHARISRPVAWGEGGGKILLTIHNFRLAGILNTENSAGGVTTKRIH